jgi:archaemetzincin
MHRLYIVPFGGIEDIVLETLKVRFEEEFGWEIKVGVMLNMPETAYDETRNQYEAIHVLRTVLENIPQDASRVLAIVNEDLFIPMLTFVFGQAQIQGKIALMSLARLRQEYYGLLPNSSLYLSRVEKEAMHEVGHTFGLVHCSEKQCVMALANAIQQVDGKKTEYCHSCTILLRDRLRSLETSGEKEKQ